MKFWKFENRVNTSGAPAANATKPAASLRMYGNMGRWNDVDERYFVQELEALESKELDVYIGSPGGAVQTGLAIYNALRRFAANGGALRTHAEGIVASAATLPFLAGDVRSAPAGTLVMVHLPLTPYTSGNAEELRETADTLDKFTDSIADIYALRTGKTQDEAKALMRGTTWMTASEAVANGFATVAPDAPQEATAALEGDVLMVAGQSFGLDQLPALSAANLAYMLGAPAPKAPQQTHAAPAVDATNVQQAGAAGTKEGDGPMDLEKLKAEHPGVYAAALAAGADAERARIDAINDATPAGFEADAKLAIEQKHSPEQFALALLKKQKQQSGQFLENRQADATAPDGANAAPAARDDAPTAEALDDAAFAAAVKQGYSQKITARTGVGI